MDRLEIAVRDVAGGSNISGSGPATSGGKDVVENNHVSNTTEPESVSNLDIQ